MPTATLSNHNSFRKGWKQRRAKDTYQMKLKLMQALNITTDNAFYARVRGESSPTKDEVIAIENVFREYGISKNIWGDLD